MQQVDATPLSDEELQGLDAYWRAANYLSVGQIYLLANPLLREPLRPEHIKPRLLGHWGTTPGLNLVYTHLNRVIRQRERELMYVIGPGHGGPAIVANTWLEGSWTATYPNTTQDEPGMARLFKQFSFPGGIPSHVAPEVPGSINEGGELGYSLSHAYGAAADNPDLVVACVIGDGEAETGPLATSWHSNKFLDPRRDGAVLPILHLNGYKIANPAVLARIGDEELTAFLRGVGHEPYLVEGSDPATVHQALAATLDRCLDRIDEIQLEARTAGSSTPARSAWPMIVLKTPKGWTGPHTVDGEPVEDTWRSHQVPLSGVRTNGDHLRQLEDWLRSYRPDELFDADGRPVASVLELAPNPSLRMGSSPHANGGVLTRDLELPDPAEYAVPVKLPGAEDGEPTKVFGQYLRDAFVLNESHHNLRLFGPDETESNRLGAVYDVTGKAWLGETRDTDQHLAADGRVLEMLSEHTCQGWLEGYLLTGRHGLFSSYEAFVHIVDSMVNQHAKWLKTINRLEWRRKIPSLNYLLTSHVWRQDHNGFSHQDPGFIDHVMNKKAEVVRVYLPPDTNTLLSTMHHCLRTRNYVNVVVAGKQPQPNWLDWEAAALHCARGIGVWDFASNDNGDPDVVMACAGDVPTLETLAAVDLLREHLPELKIRVVNVVDLMRLPDSTEHPHGLSGPEFDALFTTDKPVIFAYHGYPWLIHRLTYRRTGHDNLHVRGYIEEGTTTTPFDMVVLNNLDRYHLAMDVIDRVPTLGTRAVKARQYFADQRVRHRAHTTTYGEDLPEVRDWRWGRRG
ncbi:phosphoketolase [Kribbella sp. ALI-6-A]|uniref:phosphoketolase family protein n=1 Tax=Kribbella sp. ALI-6-A TaxID=1933817 RepID=UPI00097C3816|nr:phosphoketolase family protein [Kribbella sp. ALI-6-A]ONI67002.1 phosphoketolase [Kribbella sp. ALI-6-A]